MAPCRERLMTASDSAASIDRRVLGLFETPVVISRLADAAALNDGLRHRILAKRKEHPGISRSNTLGWHSDTDMLKWGGEEAVTLLRHFVALADLQTVDGGQKAEAPPRFAWGFEMWANVSPPNASNQSHAHPGALWSAVYYVDDGYQGSADRALGGELVLYDPRFPMNAMYAPDFRLRDSRGQVQTGEQGFRPAAGTMVAFPSWLMHSVQPYRGHAERISVAINLSLVPADRT